MKIIIVRPPAELRIPRRTAARANFVVINKGARKASKVLSDLWFKVGYKTNTKQISEISELNFESLLVTHSCFNNFSEISLEYLLLISLKAAEISLEYLLLISLKADIRNFSRKYQHFFLLDVIFFEM